MNTFIYKMKRPANLAIASGLVLSSLLMPWLLMNSASAAQISSRSITMQDSAPGATTTQYEVAFKVSTAHTNLEGIVVEFCDNSPLPAIACTITDGTIVPTITDVTAPLTNLSTTTSLSGGWTGSSANSAHTYKLSDATGNAVASGDANYVRFKFGATNPTGTAGTFYARIYTYNDSANVAGHTGGATVGTTIDSGGIALSTANQISITARVQEQLTFCVNKSATTGCTVGGSPTLEIGHGGPPIFIDSTAVDTDTAVFGLATNASSGVIVRMRGNTLTSGSNDIDPRGAAALAIVAGTEMFGMQVTATGAGITADANYSGNYGFDLANTFTATTGYGDPVASTTGPIGPTGPVDSTLTFGATASQVTPAGVYTTALDLIATGTY